MRCLAMMTVCLAAAAGCDSGSKLLPPVRSDTPLGARLAAALAMTNLSERDGALVKVAEDAGTEGDGEVVKQALANMTNVSRRDDAASISALKLAKAGHAADATEVAKTITNISKRDAVLAKLAKGDTGP
ncbi:MAG: hypothetical protein ACJ8F7_08380 [Gemmataceae bacterium]